MASKLRITSTDWEFIDNADENCGTGEGGFKKGNTCAKGAGNRFVKASVFTKREEQNRIARESNQPWRRAPSLMGGFPDAYLTEEGAKVIEASRRFIGRKPTYRGFSKQGMYFKYEVKNEEDSHNISIFRDWLEDEGFNVELEHKKGTKEKEDRSRQPRYEDRDPETGRVRRRSYHTVPTEVNYVTIKMR